MAGPSPLMGWSVSRINFILIINIVAFKMFHTDRDSNTIFKFFVDGYTCLLFENRSGSIEIPAIVIKAPGK